MTKDQAYQLIDSYIQNTLSIHDKLKFEEWLTMDMDLQFEVELQQLTSEVLIAHHLESVQKELQSFHHKQIQKTKWIKFGVAAIITCVCVFSIYLWNNKSLEAKSTTTKNQITMISEENTSMIDSASAKSPKTIIKTPNVPSKNKVKTVEPEPTSNLTSTTSSFIEEKGKDIPVVHTKKEEPVSTSNTQQQLTTIVRDPCDGIQISSNYQIIGTCPNKNDGQVIISKITGGTSPYQYELKHNNQLVSLSHLEYGQYSLTIKDKNNCEVTYSNIKVPNLNCQENFVFNPFIGETWKTIVGNKSGQMIIYDISGNMYYQKSFTSNEEIEWNGVSVRGNTLSGQYIYIIKYSDGLSTTGNITLVD